MKNKARTAGRKPLPVGAKRDQRVAVYFTQDEYEIISTAARAEGKTEAQLIASIALERLRAGFADRIAALPEAERKELLASVRRIP